MNINETENISGTDSAVFSDQHKQSQEWNKRFLQIVFLFVVLMATSFSFFQSPKTAFLPLQKVAYAPDPSVSASSTLVVRLNTGEVMYQKNADTRSAIASLTKLMTGVLLVENTNPMSLITFGEDAKKLKDPTAKKSGVSVGEKIKAEDAAKLLLVESDNDAAFAVAGASSSVADFVGLMNKKAIEVGMQSTHFANPAGFDDPENYSTAVDLQKLIRYAYENHTGLWGISRMAAGEIIGVSGKEYHFSTTNQLLKTMPGMIYGGKTGMTDEARGALILLYQPIPRETISMVILGSRDRFQDARNIIQWLQTAFVWPESKS